ncbi:hypothetical protein [Methylobacterium nonmethylotrophicum]|uniref:hypothetical protein n=1 Tax=Methylobacterium nonmethylotrophicum TaxID=1141884 RepID=UPI0014367968|nr:hypothetical protein [Methylobacterium nonmethylotrophicum]
MQDRPALKAAFSALIPLAGIGFVAGEEADLDEDREGAPHTGFCEAKAFVLGQRAPVYRERAQEPPGAAPEAREEVR